MSKGIKGLWERVSAPMPGHQLVAPRSRPAKRMTTAERMAASGSREAVLEELESRDELAGDESMRGRAYRRRTWPHPTSPGTSTPSSAGPSERVPAERISTNTLPSKPPGCDLDADDGSDLT